MSESLPATRPLLDARQRLLEAAEIVFAEKGYDAASVREICAKASANIAAINYHFGDKETLYAEVVKNAHDCALPGNEVPIWPPGVPAEQRLRDFIRVMLGQLYVPARASALKVVMREMADPSAAGRAVVRDHIRPKAFTLRDIIRDLYPGRDDAGVLMIGFSVIGQILFYRQNRRTTELLFGEDAISALSLEMVTEHVTRFTLAALGRTVPLARRWMHELGRAADADRGPGEVLRDRLRGELRRPAHGPAELHLLRADAEHHQSDPRH